MSISAPISRKSVTRSLHSYLILKKRLIISLNLRCHPYKNQSLIRFMACNIFCFIILCLLNIFLAVKNLNEQFLMKANKFFSFVDLFVKAIQMISCGRSVLCLYGWQSLNSYSFTKRKDTFLTAYLCDKIILNTLVM